MTMSNMAGLSKTDDVLVAAAADVSRTRADLGGDLTALRSRLEQLSGQWEGQGERAFRGAIETWQHSADQVIGALDTFESQLRASEGTYAETDDGVAAALNRYAGILG
jgi:WXG100 family type VII secretion target